MQDQSFLDFVDAGDVGQAVLSFDGVLERTGHHQALQIGIVTGDGDVRQADVVAENCLTDPGIGMILINVADPEDRRRSVHLLDAQAEVIRQLALGATADETLGAVLAFLERVLPGYRAAAYLGDDLIADRSTSAPTLPVEFTRRMAGWIRSNPAVPGAMALDGVETIIAADLADPAWADARNAVDGEFGAIWSIPMSHQHGGESFGIIELYGPHASHPRDEDWVTLRLGSRLAAAGIERLRLQQRLVAAAEIDPLTSAPNRRVITSILFDVISADETGHAVCFVDLDRLKVVNDSLGHEAGDQLIREAAHRLVGRVGDLGVVGRFGGDEFVAIATSPDVTPDELAGVAIRRSPSR